MKGILGLNFTNLDSSATQVEKENVDPNQKQKKISNLEGLS